MASGHANTRDEEPAYRPPPRPLRRSSSRNIADYPTSQTRKPAGIRRGAGRRGSGGAGDGGRISSCGASGAAWRHVRDAHRSEANLADENRDTVRALRTAWRRARATESGDHGSPGRRPSTGGPSRPTRHRRGAEWLAVDGPGTLAGWFRLAHPTETRTGRPGLPAAARRMRPAAARALGAHGAAPNGAARDVPFARHRTGWVRAYPGRRRPAGARRPPAQAGRAGPPAQAGWCRGPGLVVSRTARGSSSRRRRSTPRSTTLRAARRSHPRSGTGQRVRERSTSCGGGLGAPLHGGGTA